LHPTAFVLLCLDVRRTRPEALQGDGDIDAVEKAAIGACVALVLKLSEIRFTPLFMTALEWSRASPERAARPLAFFRLTCALSDALRSVFVPFYKHLLADAVAYLTSGPTQQQPTSKKARRTADAAELGADGLAAWSLRVEVVAALRLCFLHDTSSFVDEARFNMLLPALVQQLDTPLPPGADDAAVSAADDILVDSLAQLAVAVGQDTLWRALNRAVLMATRALVVRPRRLGVAVVAALVERLAEEYLVMLPETLPFLAELVEDADEDVEAGARQLLTKLSLLAEEDVADLLAA
jgi:U3 small nucleolar RNA-associated protein 10